MQMKAHSKWTERALTFQKTLKWISLYLFNKFLISIFIYFLLTANMRFLDQRQGDYLQNILVLLSHAPVSPLGEVMRADVICMYKAVHNIGEDHWNYETWSLYRNCCTSAPSSPDRRRETLSFNVNKPYVGSKKQTVPRCYSSLEYKCVAQDFITLWNINKWL